MPPTPIPVNYGIATVAVELVAAAQEFVVTFGFHNIPSNDAATNAATIQGIWNSNFPAASTLDSYKQIQTNVLQNVGGTLQSGTDVVSITGTVAAAPCSPAQAVRVTKRTLFAGRGFRGRMFLPPAYLSEANVNAAGVIDGATVTSLQGKVDGLLADLTAASLPMYLLHHDGSTPDAVQNLLVRSTIGTQRRRQILA